MYWRRVLLAATLVFPRLGIAEVQLSQDWFLELGDGTVVYAATLNSQQRLLGQYCDLNDKSCMYLVTLGMSCTGDDEYPSILNSDAGVIEVPLICGHLIDNANVFYITPFDDVGNCWLGGGDERRRL